MSKGHSSGRGRGKRCTCFVFSHVIPCPAAAGWRQTPAGKGEPPAGCTGCVHEVDNGEMELQGCYLVIGYDCIELINGFRMYHTFDQLQRLQSRFV